MDQKHKIEIHFAPMQSYTDRVYRKVYNQNFHGVDYYYTPYLSCENDLSVRNVADVSGVDEPLKSYTVPQLLPSGVAELKILMKTIAPYNYSRLNINMGCPYPMVVRKGRGSALIQHPQIVKELIDYIHDNSNYNVSLKMRTGLQHSNEILELLDRIPFNKISSVIIHPRTAVQLYKGEADILMYMQCIHSFPQMDFIYNGDIFDLESYHQKEKICFSLNKVMLGRGLLLNPYLASQIRLKSDELPQNYQKNILKFCMQLIEEIEADSREEGHALNRSKLQFLQLLKGNNSWDNLRRKVKKAKSLDALKEIILHQQDMN